MINYGQKKRILDLNTYFEINTSYIIQVRDFETLLTSGLLLHLYLIIQLT